MADRPILMSSSMVLACLREVERPGTGKTQTRRILKPQPYPLEGRPGYWNASGCVGGRIVISDDALAQFHRFAKGDRLYVRERVWLPEGGDNPHGHITYHADHGDDRALKWRPGIHMPRWASRLTLTVTDVRVERLQAISEADCLAEGVIDMGRMDGEPWAHCHVPGVTSGYENSPVACYATVWEHINGAGIWGANPWVAAISFKPERRNIDA